ncbi:MAG: cytochrome c [Burkholderiales bacterium]|nr:cytochrome c [Burkholderiales bacterium]
MRILTVAPLAAALAAPLAAHAQDAARGRALYETRCIACHSTSVHNRSARKATDFEGVRAQVVRWSREAGSPWTAEEIDDVSVYLNELYYRFPCPRTICRSEARAARG